MQYIRFIISVIALLCYCSSTSAQRSLHPLNTYVYFSYDYDSDHTDTSNIHVNQLLSQLQIVYGRTVKNPIPGYSEEFTYVDYRTDSIYYLYKYSDSTYCVASTMKRSDIKWDTLIVDSKTTKYTTTINSNRIELLFSTKEGTDVNPLPYYGKFRGVLIQMVRNGLVQIELSGRLNGREKMKQLLPDNMGIRKTGREMSIIRRERMILTTHVFENEQICWGKEKPTITDIPFDTTLHYAGGTLILKRILLPKLPSHYQTFIELRQRSNGDAYDRTGSVFVIPLAGTNHPNFLDGIFYHPDSLPTIVGKDGERYQGIVAAPSTMKKYKDYLNPYSSFIPGIYEPPVELMRFFTPFGVGKFNDRVKIDGLEWEDETFYKQEVTELQSLLEGEVWIGCFIGNYDGGGHIVNLDIKSYPNDYEWALKYRAPNVVSLINTCNVLEMAGQNYGKIFGTDSITVHFNVEEGDSVLTLRYISTGHGGWGGGDEFNPKENEIFIDGNKMFSYTPWRCDCARYREWNPVSGNFWNGISSSDLSRSGWCPGTATQPVYFDLSDLKPGNHTLTIAIPQGKTMDGGFSHWNVSAQLIRHIKKTHNNK